VTTLFGILILALGVVAFFVAVIWAADEQDDEY